MDICVKDLIISIERKPIYARQSSEAPAVAYGRQVARQARPWPAVTTALACRNIKGGI